MIKELLNFQKFSPLVILILFVNKQQTAEWFKKPLKYIFYSETCSLLELHEYFNLLWIINNTLASLQILTQNISHR